MTRLLIQGIGTSILGCLCFTDALVAAPPRHLDVAPTLDVQTLSQNWNDDEASRFYNVPQGSRLLPYKWFLNLEQPDSDATFRDAANLRGLGYLPRTSDPQNPDGLPVGFVKDGVHLGITCAACHTTLVTHGDKAWLIDGAPGLGDFERLLRRLAESFQTTLTNPQKFQRFAQGVVQHVPTAGEAAALRTQVESVLEFRQSYNDRNLPGPGRPPFGPGRVDAFGAIMNEVTSTFAHLPNNFAAADAPVSYPFLWDTPHHDRVQWNGAAENTESVIIGALFGTKAIGALGRNTGEVLGVFGQADVVADDLLPRGYPSSVNLSNLIDIEDSLRNLWSPQWPQDLPPVDEALRSRGEVVFQANCAHCHAAIERTDPDRAVTAWLKAPVGTDETMARNFALRQASTGRFQNQLIKIPGLLRFGMSAPVKELLEHSVKRVLLGGGGNGGGIGGLLQNPLPFGFTIAAEVDLGDQKLLGRFENIEFREGRFISGRVAVDQGRKSLSILRGGKLFHLDTTHPELGRFLDSDAAAITIGRLAAPETAFGQSDVRVALTEAAKIRFIYKARPLNGIWATAPYLHNGSVPNLDELLKPPAKRVVGFRVGSREFDPVRVGFRSDVGDFKFDASLPGNSNAGHDYKREFSDDERRQLIEYLKSL